MIETGVNQDAQIIRLGVNPISQFKSLWLDFRASRLFMVYLNIIDYKIQVCSLYNTIAGGRKKQEGGCV